MKEETIEAYLDRRVKEVGGETRKVQWIGRRSAPDRLVMLGLDKATARLEQALLNEHRPEFARELLVELIGLVSPWVELKNPETIKTFPADERERAQAREHERMRALGQRVVVIGTKEQIEELLS